MAEFTLRQKISNAQDHAADLQHQYLQVHGWQQTCNTPGSYWLWKRDFADEDAARHARWEKRGPGPLGLPSEPRPYGVVTADTELALGMTMKELDDEIDQDGDPESPALTAEDFDTD